MLTDDGNRLDGCIFGEPADADYRMEFGDQTLPKKVDLRPHCSPVEDQGKIGSCTANACVGALEYHYIKRDGTAPDLSRMFVYYNTRRLKGTIQQDTGAMINEAMASVMAFGACESQHWPYDVSLFAQEPPQPAYADGLKHEAVQYARVGGAQGAIGALANGMPVVYGTFMPQRCYEEAGRTGRIPATTYDERTGRPGGGHCMLIVGYDLDQQIFIVRNSWGTGWGNGGYCDIPFTEMAYWSPPETFWIILALEPKGNFAVIRPLQDSAEEQKQKIAGFGTRKLGTTARELRDEIGASLRAEMDQRTAGIKQTATRLRAELSGEPATAPGEAAFGAFCNSCSGTGSCFYCGGRGINVIPDVDCPRCLGRGFCNSCGGNGET